MEWLWTVIAMAIAGGATYLIAKYNLSGKIAELVKNSDEVKDAVLGVYTAFSTSFKPDADGSVRLTPAEVTAIKEAIGKLLALFGIKLPV